MEQFDQLLTCCVCLDRYRNPKLLPCQHSFCMEPCMEGLVDYVRRQVKCPECRAEHRIPYQGVQAFPTNVTLQRFLELHMDITGELPDPTSNQVMERCQVCSEKSYLNMCAHCEKKVCQDCKDAHLDVIRREITRLSSQVRRVLHRLEDALSAATKNLNGLKGTSSNVLEEVDDLCRRFTKAIKDKGDGLRRELENYVSTELTTLNSYKSNLETEISNINSNCELVDKYVVAENSTLTWDDQELMDTKDLFLRTMEFIRNFEYEPGDRRIRFTVNQDPNTIVVGLTNFGDLVFPGAVFTQHQPLSQASQPPQFAANTGIMRSKSDHRLVQQYRDMDEAEQQNSASTRSKYSKYGSNNDDSGDGRKFRSRFTRRLLAAQDDDDRGSNVRFNDGSGGGGGGGTSGSAPLPTAARVLDTDDAMKGPLSGISRLLDSTRVLEKMVELENPKKKPTSASANAPVVPQAIQQQMQILQAQQLHQQQQLLQNAQQLQQQQSQSSCPWRQSSQEKSNSTPAKTTPVAAAAAANAAVVSSLARKQSAEKARSESESSSDQHSGSSSSTSSSSHRNVNTGASFTTDEVKQKFQSKGNTPQKSGVSATSANAANSSASAAGGNKFRRQVTPVASTTKDDSDSSSEETESSDEDDEPAPTPSSNTTSKMEKTDIGPILARSAIARDRDQPSSTIGSGGSGRSRTTRDDGGVSSTTSSISRQSSRDDQPSSGSRSRGLVDDNTTSSSRSRDAPMLERRVSRDDGAGPNYSAYRNRQPKSPPETSYSSSRTGAGSTAASRYGTSSASSPYDYGLSRSRTGTTLYEPPESTSRLQSKYLNRSRHNLGGSMDHGDDLPLRSSGNITSSPYSNSSSSSPYYSGRSAYLAKHRDHHSHAASGSNSNRDNDSRKSSSREKSSRDRDRDRERERDKSKLLSRSKSSHELVPGELADSSSGGGKKPEDEQSLSSWARYLKSKYGKTVGKDSGSNNNNNSSSNSHNNPSDSSSSHNNNSNNTNNNANSSNGSNYLSNERSDGGYNSGFGSGSSNNNNMSNNSNSSNNRKSSSPQKLNLPASQYSGKKRLVFKFGSRGSDPGYFTWPRGVAVGPDGSIVVADSSNHRIQQFDAQGNFIKEFGTYGNSDGEFDCLAGVAVNRIGQFIVSDRYNHRIQVFDPSGRFLRSFGSQGSADGKFSYPWGVATDALGFIYVCDKENNRVQVFQSDGTFVGKFGVGELEHPHYIAVTCTNKVVVSDTAHHRVVMFDVNGKVISSIGTEGTENNQFKLPRGVAVDEQGYIFVGDSGNNRVQIFSPDGIHIKSFGCWGSMDGEFKGLEGVAVNSNGNVLVCDRESHRICCF